MRNYVCIILLIASINDLYCSGKTNTKYQDIMQFKDFNYVSILDYVR